MTDEFMIQWLMGMTTYVVHLHHRLRKEPEAKSNAGPRFEDDSISWETEGFSRWMGWRGPEAQEEEIRNQQKSG